MNDDVNIALRKHDGDIRMYCIYCMKYRERNGSETDTWYREWKKSWKS